MEPTSLLLGSEPGSCNEKTIGVPGHSRCDVLEVQEPGDLVERRFRLQMRLRLGLLEDRCVYSEIALGKGTEHFVADGLRIVGGMKDFV